MPGLLARLTMFAIDCRVKFQWQFRPIGYPPWCGVIEAPSHSNELSRAGGFRSPFLGWLVTCGFLTKRLNVQCGQEDCWYGF